MEMQQHQQHNMIKSTPAVEIKLDGDDTKFITNLSTILVATLQETKDRISQMEYIFCSQLYPKFQESAGSLQDIYCEAKQAAEATWRERTNNLLQQIEKLKLDKEEVAAQNQSLRVEMSELNGKLRAQHLRIDELEHGLIDKSKEVDDGMELHRKLMQRVESNACRLEEELKQKGGELVKVREVEGHLQKKLEAKDTELLEKKQLLLDLEKEKGQVIDKLEDKIIRLEEMLQKKIGEAQELRKLSQELRLDHSEAIKNKAQLNEHQEEPEGMVYEFKVKDLQKKLLDKIRVLECDLLSEKKKYTNLVQRHKSLKSEHIYLLRKTGHTSDNMLPQHRSVEQENSLRCEEDRIDMPCIENKNAANSSVDDGGLRRVKEEIDIDDRLEHEKEEKSFNSRRSFPSTHKTPVSGTKRPASSWIETRPIENRYGLDPHDDFLDTPFENIKQNMNNARIGEAEIHPPKEINNNNNNFSDDETQDMNVDDPCCPQKKKKKKKQQQMAAPSSSDGKKSSFKYVEPKSSFKYVEPVRKKADRENLKGIECKQCKKFYDAVLPENNDNSSNMTDLRCEHHEGVSRHRYKYLPPMTPDGFWNIGFESEM